MSKIDNVLQKGEFLINHVGLIRLKSSGFSYIHATPRNNITQQRNAIFNSNANRL